MEGFPRNSREIAQIVGGQNVGSMQVKRSNPEKTRTLPLPEHDIAKEFSIQNHKPFNLSWKRLKGRNPEGKNFRKLLRRKQSSAKISKISRNTIKSSKSDIFYLLRNLLKYLLRTFFLPRSFQKFLPFAFLSSGSFRLGCTPRGSCNNTLLRRVLIEGSFTATTFLRRVLRPVRVSVKTSFLEGSVS